MALIDFGLLRLLNCKIVSCAVVITQDGHPDCIVLPFVQENYCSGLCALGDTTLANHQLIYGLSISCLGWRCHLILDGVLPIWVKNLVKKLKNNSGWLLQERPSANNDGCRAYHRTLLGQVRYAGQSLVFNSNNKSSSDRHTSYRPRLGIQIIQHLIPESHANLSSPNLKKKEKKKSP